MTAGVEPAERARSRARERLWTPTRERAEILTALSELFADPDVTPDGALEASVVVLAELLGDVVMIDRVAPDRAILPRALHHPDPAAPKVLDRAAARADHGFTAWVLETGRSLLIPQITAAEVAALQPELATLGEALGGSGFVLAPLMARGRCLGLLWQVRVRSEPQLVEDDRRFLEEAAVRLALHAAHA